MGIQSVIAEILFVRYVNSINNTGTIEQRKNIINHHSGQNDMQKYLRKLCTYMRSVKVKQKSMEQENASSTTNESKKPRKARNLHSQENLDLCMSFAIPKRGSLPVIKCRFVYFQVYGILARFIFLKLPVLKRHKFAIHLQIHQHRVKILFVS